MNNVCVPAIDNCVDYESTGACLNCADTYVEVADDKCCPQILNCKVYDSTTCGFCDQLCGNDQIESHNGICVTEIDNCGN